MPRDPLILGRIPPVLEARVLAECERTGSSKSELLRAALTAFLPPEGGTPTPKAPVAAARATRGRAAMCSHRVPAGSYCRKCNA